MTSPESTAQDMTRESTGMVERLRPVIENALLSADIAGETYGSKASRITEAVVAAIHDQDGLREALVEAKLQLEYLDVKFKRTGTTAAVLARINRALKGDAR